MFNKRWTKAWKDKRSSPESYSFLWCICAITCCLVAFGYAAFDGPGALAGYSQPVKWLVVELSLIEACERFSRDFWKGQGVRFSKHPYLVARVTVVSTLHDASFLEELVVLPSPWWVPMIGCVRVFGAWVFCWSFGTGGRRMSQQHMGQCQNHWSRQSCLMVVKQRASSRANWTCSRIRWQVCVESDNR